MMATQMMARLVFTGLFSLVVLPLVALLVWSFSPQWNFPTLVPPDINAAAWVQLANGKLGEATLNSFIIAASVTAISILVGFPSGRIFAKHQTILHRTISHRTILHQAISIQTLQTLMLFPTLLPTVMLAIGVQFLFTALALSGTMLGVVLAHLIVTLPYAALISTGIFSSFNFNYELQARTLGASAVQALWFVTGPALAAGALGVALFSFLISWSQFALTIQIGAGRVSTLPMLVFAYINGGNMQFATASTAMLVLPTLLILVVSHRTMQAVQSWQA
jgi:putative spermidine/putrescine transport system permease protein